MRFNFSTCRLALTVFAVIYLFFTNTALSQNEYNQLVLQDGYFWNFNNIPMTLTKGFPQIYSNFLSSVCDNNGNLMFYSCSQENLFLVYDKNNEVIFQKEKKKGEWSIMYALKSPNEENLYYIIASIHHNYNHDTLICIRIAVDDFGKYNITSNTFETHGVWSFLIPYIYSGEIFVICQNAPDGINIFKIDNNNFLLVNSYRSSDMSFDYNFFTKIKFNNDCSKLISNQMILDYDITNQKITGHKVLSEELSSFELSENGYYLYFSTVNGRSLLRCKTSDADNIDKLKEFDTIASDVVFDDMILCKDENIYMMQFSKNDISVLKNSNSEDCEYFYQAVDYKALKNRGYLRFPLVVRTYFSFECNASCQETSFEYHGYPAAAFEWDFGDGTPKVTQKNPIHAYKKNGKYLVTLKVSLTDNSIRTIKKEIEIKNILNNLIIERVD